MSDRVCDVCGYSFLSRAGVAIHKATKHRLSAGTMASDNYTELKMCRVCLALDVKMYDMKDMNLSEMFQNITGILARNNKYKVYRVCWECAARLTAAAAFRDKALLSDALLKDLVNIQPIDIAFIKENYSYLKSPLTVHTIFTLDIVCSDAKEIESNNDMVEETNQVENKCEDLESWIKVPLKMEIETDPLVDSSMNIEEEKPDLFLDTSNFCNEGKDHEDKKPILDVDDSDTSSSGKGSADDMFDNDVEREMSSSIGTSSRNSNIRINDTIKEKIIELKKNGVPVVGISRETGVSQSSINGFWRRYCKAGSKYPKSATGQSDKVDGATESAEVGEDIGAFKPTEKRKREARLKHVLMTAPVTAAAMKQKISKRKELHDDLKQRIIDLKEEGMPTRQVARVLRTTRNTVRKWWARWDNEGHMNNFKGGSRKNKKTTPQEDQRLIDLVAQGQSVHTPTLAKELGISTSCVRRRLKESGFRVKQKKASVPLRSGRSHKVDKDTKQQIISMKQNGISVTEIANQFRVTRTSVYRWCKENNINVTNDHISTTTDQDQGAAEDGNVGNRTQPPIIISAYKSVWQKLPDVEFVS